MEREDVEISMWPLLVNIAEKREEILNICLATFFPEVF